MKILHIVSILLEVLVAVLGVMLAAIKKKRYGFYIALTFAIYVFYDLVNFGDLNVPRNLTYLLFFISSASILWAVWRIYKES